MSLFIGASRPDGIPYGFADFFFLETIVFLHTESWQKISDVSPSLFCQDSLCRKTIVSTVGFFSYFFFFVVFFYYAANVIAQFLLKKQTI